ncbi:MAG: phosphate/phosphite/phosphonate ABC transporter substrate-binding protein [Sphingomonadaceae bacterium]|uniref:phosphate/phosphite/phosphonate ABC transporter substrate-binding protein n=1 Tax=Thermaurantiacus sp. TaxID=2820283 RepID=UPI00298F1BE4|nr:PhnD/SsuA/transferrin family substrate-binding protein [Thermaurantiacus sp.]MCS6987339.1 phosphate/phosphite/phosphonate ABC transporter substrate-binding protein [Sphingomonadaceae bacterium]MDW8414560.1 PhnD/SsuA/transferrin family substrate-binding protein [Thermaurantiacus sp.]
MPMIARRTLIAAAGAALLARPAPAADRRPWVFAFQPQKDPAGIRRAADEMAAALGARLEREVRVLVPLAYPATVQALVSRQADVAWLSSLPFLLARRDGGARLILAEVRTDSQGRARTDYDSVFVVRRDSPLKDFADLKRRAPALAMVFTSSTSTSGFVFPYDRFIREGMLKPRQPPETLFRQVAYAGGYTQALEQVLAGRGDVCAVSDYTVEGPRRTVYLPEEKQRELRILERTPGVPTHLIAVSAAVDARNARAIRDALLDLSRTRPTLLSDVYGASALAVVDEDRHVAATVRAIERTGLPIRDLVR